MDTVIQNVMKTKCKKAAWTSAFLKCGWLWLALFSIRKNPYQENINCVILYAMYEDRKEYGGKTMRIEQVPAYELVLTQDIPDIHSKGYLLKHKKSGAR